MDELGINIDAFRGRQQRLLQTMRENSVELVITTRIEHVQWLAGPRFAWTFQPAAALDLHGKLTLIAPQKAPEIAAADVVDTYEAKWHSTLRNDQGEEYTEVLQRVLGSSANVSRIGVEFSCFPQYFQLDSQTTLFDVEPTFYRLRRRKDPDELARIRKAIQGTARMYEAAREMIAPGVKELDVFNRLQSAAVTEFGEMLTGTGNDYRCASRGGAPRDRQARAGELYIFKIFGPAFRGYFADNARTIAVTSPTVEQTTAWRHIMKVFEHIEHTARPGKNARELFNECDAILREAPVGEFNHHLGHGIGLFPHEAPHLNPHWDDTFEVGDVFTAEPGLYAEELDAGMRIENDYVVTHNGIELLTPMPLEL